MSGMDLVVSNQTDGNTGALVTTTNNAQKQIQVRGVQRTSTLFAPIMQLVGHGGSIFATKFHPDGQTLATASFDKEIWLWRVFGETCENYSILKGHKNAVLDIAYSHRGATLMSCSADKTVALYEIESGQRTRTYSEHRAIVNSCSSSRTDEDRFATVSDDGVMKIWDGRQRHSAMTITHPYPLTAVCFAAQPHNVFAGGIDNVIRMYDLRKDGEVSMELRAHDDTISGLALSPDGGFLLSNSFDCTLRHWDIKPFCSTDRCLKTFMGHEHSADKNLLRCSYSSDGTHVASGSGDRMVYVWNVATTKIMFKLPGHKGCVNEVVFHPEQPIIASCSNDKTVFLGELDLS